MRDGIYWIICTCTALVIAILSLRYVTGFWLLALLFSLHLHIAFLAIFGALAALVVHRGRIAALLLVSALALFAHGLWMKYEVVPPRREAIEGSTPFRLLSFNMLADNFRNAERIAGMLQTSGADAVVILEAAPLQGYLAGLQATFPYRLGCGTVSRSCDLLVLSKHPIRSGRYESLSDLRPDRFVLAEIDVAGQTLHLAGAHLTKPYYDDYHWLELREMSRHLSAVGDTLLLAGDFNADSIALDMRFFLRRNGMTAAGWEPATWPVRAGRFGVAIDHIYLREGLNPLGVSRLKDNYGSNHFGLIADVAIPPRPGS